MSEQHEMAEHQRRYGPSGDLRRSLPASEQAALLCEQLAGRLCELDACDGYLVVFGHPDDVLSPHAWGPVSGPEAIAAADLCARALGASPLVVRLHHPS